jgi:outer membrane protein TolC
MGRAGASWCLPTAAWLFLAFGVGGASAQELRLQELVDEALRRNPEVLASQSKAKAARHRVPQVQSLPDPMFMTGYQNEGFSRYTYGQMPDAQWMFSASQMFPFPGKLALKGEMASREAEGLGASSETVRLRVIARVKELYYELFLAHKIIDILKRTQGLFSRLEDAALARYGSGLGQQQEILMAQTEKYMLHEREEMQRQRIQAAEAMLNNALGRPAEAPLGRPEEREATPFPYSLEDLLRMAGQRATEIQWREKMVAAADARVRMARREFFPDLTLAANYFNRGNGQFDDMWSLTATVNVPIFFRTKQEEGVHEAEASLSEARHELEAARLMTASALRDAFSMLKTAENLMALYKDAVLPKNYQDFELALAGYVTGKIEAITVISRVRAFLDTEILYWVQFAAREKAVARQEALVGGFPGGR